MPQGSWDTQADTVLLDVWGVLHDGRTPYPDAPAWLAHAKAEGVAVSLVSNASWTSARLRHHLGTLGFDLSGVTSVTTAGDVARGLLAGFHRRGAQRLHLIGRPESLALVAGLGFELTELDQAQVVLLSDVVPQAVERLALIRERGLPLVCSNPDLKITSRAGEAQAKPGSLLSSYEAAGGLVLRAGKPDPLIFQLALSHHPQASEVRLVGDSPETDLAGAQAAGLPAVWLDRRGHPHAEAIVERYRPVQVIRHLIAPRGAP